MSKRWVKISLEEPEARDYTQAIAKAIEILRRAALSQLSITEAVETEKLTFLLSDLSDLIERGFDESDVPMDEWQRPVLPPTAIYHGTSLEIDL